MLTAGERAGLEQPKVVFQSELRPEGLDKREQVTGCSPPQPSGLADEENAAGENPHKTQPADGRETSERNCASPREAQALLVKRLPF